MSQSKDENIYQIVEKIVSTGNLYDLTSKQRFEYYNQLCKFLGINPATMPFRFFENKTSKGPVLSLYLTKGGAEQLREKRQISIHSINRIKEEYEEGYLHIMTVDGYCIDTGRKDIATAAIFIDKNPKDFKGAFLGSAAKGEYISNCLMKLETKAKRRLTLSFSGLGIPDESEIDSIPYSRHAVEEDKVIEGSSIDDDIILEFRKAKSIVSKCRNVEDLKDKFISICSDLSKYEEEDRYKAYMPKFADFCKSKKEELTKNFQSLEQKKENHDDE